MGESEGRMSREGAGAAGVEERMGEGSRTCSRGSSSTRASQTPEPGQHRTSAAPVPRTALTL